MVRKEEETESKPEEKQLREASQPNVVEVEVTLSLLNQKLNYLISKVEEIKKVL